MEEDAGLLLGQAFSALAQWTPGAVSISVVGAVLGTVGSRTASLVSAHQMPVALPSPSQSWQPQMSPTHPCQ